MTDMGESILGVAVENAAARFDLKNKQQVVPLKYTVKSYFSTWFLKM